MSKQSKQTVKIPVETVKNYQKMIEYMFTSLEFWKKDNEWPINLCIDGLKYMSNDLYIILEESKGEIPF